MRVSGFYVCCATCVRHLKPKFESPFRRIWPAVRFGALPLGPGALFSGEMSLDIDQSVAAGMGSAAIRKSGFCGIRTKVTVLAATSSQSPVTVTSSATLTAALSSARWHHYPSHLLQPQPPSYKSLHSLTHRRACQQSTWSPSTCSHSVSGCAPKRDCSGVLASLTLSRRCNSSPGGHPRSRLSPIQRG